MKALLAVILTAGALLTGAARAQDETTALRAAHVTFDEATLRAGARTFAQYCLGCHTLKYLRYSRVSEDLNLSRAQVQDMLMLPANAQFYGTMTNTLRPQEAAKWLGAAPPDLTLEARYRGTDWIYSYLTGFYADPATTSGWNNHVFPHVSMPNVLAPLGGVRDAGGRLITPGAMPPARFDTEVRQLTSWLAYTSDPSRSERYALGRWVLPFLALLTLLTYLLKRAYWRDIH